MSFAEQPASKQWAALTFRGEKLAEVWFKPASEPLGLQFRIPRTSFQLPGIGDQLTVENLLKAVAVAPDQVESWRIGGPSSPGPHNSSFDALRQALEPPADDAAHLEIHVRLMAPTQGPSPEEHAGLRAAPNWQELDMRWKAILTMEAAMETLRINMEGLMNEMENLWKKPLTMEQKTYAPRADVAVWNKAKIRVHNALPRMKDFIHRAVWAMGAAERKRLEEIYIEHVQPQVSYPEIDTLLKQLEELRKDRQILSTHGKTIYQECKGICAEIQGALRALQSNAAHAQKKKDASAKNRFF